MQEFELTPYEDDAFKELEDRNAKKESFERLKTHAELMEEIEQLKEELAKERKKNGSINNDV